MTSRLKTITQPVAVAGAALMLYAALYAASFLPMFHAGHSVSAASVLVNFETEEQAELYEALTHEYRCLKCQNQTIADSNAGLANDLRREIQGQVRAGKNREQIDEYLIARYGDFVLYRPPFKATTIVLWVGPFVLLAIALVFGLRYGRRGSGQAPTDNSLRQAKDLLK